MILVAGGGIGGLCAAMGLQAVGQRVVVLERDDQVREVGAGLTLFPNALAALDRLGVGADVRALSVPVGDGGVRVRSGRWLARQDAQGVTRLLGEPVVCVHRGELLALLADAVGGENILVSADAVGYQLEDEGITVETADGRTLRGSALIGADGVHSMVALAMHPHGVATYTGTTAWRAVTKLSESLRGMDVGFETWGVGEVFGMVPLGDDRVYWFATSNRPEGERAPTTEHAHVVEHFSPWHAPIGEVVSATPPDAVIRHDLYDRSPLPHWTAGRVTLLGDAAHPMRPNLGQGACQAIEDAVAIADCVSTHTDVVAAFAAYEARRRRDANRVVKLSRSAGKVAQLSQPLACHARNALVRILPSSLVTRRLAPIAGSIAHPR